VTCTGETGTWDSLGYAHHHLGQHHEAGTCYRRALDLRRKIGDRHSVAVTLTRLGDVHDAAGERAAAREAWLEALPVLDELGRPEAGTVRVKLTRSDSATGGDR
jgi:tetratricopeptide (TPR) repeat protein